MNVDSHLLVTKIVVPTRRNDVLKRPRLLEFLHEYIDRKLLLVSASAGYGKTSLLADFAHDTMLPLCWYTLDSRDADPQVFLEYLVAAIQRRFPHFGGRITALLQNMQNETSLDACVAALVTEIHEQIESYFVLVLDDYQMVEDSEPVNYLLDRLLTYLPDNAHLVVASRTVPARLTLTRLTARRQVAGLGVMDLRFTAEEIGALVRQNYGIEVAPDIAARLAEQSEGWITGIILTTPTLWRGLFREWVQGYSPGTQLFDYLAGEVLAQQPPALQQFLIESAVLTQMTPDLCNEVLGRTDSEECFRLVAARNLFVTQLEDQGFRYHQLFREFLLTRLQQTQPGRLYELQQQTAASFERHGNLEQAIEYWLSAGAVEPAARIIQIVAEDYYEHGRWTTLRRWLDALPNVVLRDHPTLLLIHAILLVEVGSVDIAQPQFAEAQLEFERLGDASNLARTLIESARHDRDYERALRNCEHALVIAPRHEFLLHALANRTMGIIHTLMGDWSGAILFLERACALYEIANNRHFQADAENSLGNVYWTIGNPARADLHFENALRHHRRLGHPSKLANILNSIAVQRYQQGRLTEAKELFQEALGHAREAGHLRLEAYIRAGIGDVCRDEGKLPDALEAYATASELADKIREPFLITFARVAVGDVWRANGDCEMAEAVLQTALDAATAHGSDYEVALVQLALSALSVSQQDYGAAARHLEHALPLLEQAQAKRELGRAHLALAQLAWRGRRERELLKHLRVVGAIGKALDEDQFLMRDAAEARPLLEWAIGKRVAVAYFRGLLAKVEQQGRATPIPANLLETQWPRLEMFALGEARVLLNGRAVDRSAWQTTTTKELFFFFATHPQAWRKEQVIAALWADMARGQANDLFHSSIYRLRRALFSECVVYRNGQYQLNPELVIHSDVQEFEEQLAAVEEAPSAEAKRLALEHAVALYRGEFLDEFYGDWCALRRQALSARYLDALGQLVQLAQGLGDASRTIEYCERILEKEPVHEETYRELMRAYRALGNRAAAVLIYQQCVDRLQYELGVPPMEETVALFEEVRVGGGGDEG